MAEIWFLWGVYSSKHPPQNCWISDSRIFVIGSFSWENPSFSGPIPLVGQLPNFVRNAMCSEKPMVVALRNLQGCVFINKILIIDKTCGWFASIFGFLCKWEWSVIHYIHCSSNLLSLHFRCNVNQLIPSLISLLVVDATISTMPRGLGQFSDVRFLTISLLWLNHLFSVN